MADALCATLIVMVDGVRRSNNFELTTSSRSQIEQISEALKLDRYLEQLDADYDGIQIPVGLIEGALIGDNGFYHVNGAEQPQSVVTNIAELKAAITAVTTQGVAPAIFISLT